MSRKNRRQPKRNATRNTLTSEQRAARALALEQARERRKHSCSAPEVCTLSGDCCKLVGEFVPLSRALAAQARFDQLGNLLFEQMFFPEGFVVPPEILRYDPSLVRHIRA